MSGMSGMTGMSNVMYLWWRRRPFLPCFSARSQLCGSYLWCWCLGRVLMFFVRSMAAVSRWSLYLWSWQLDLFWNTIIFVLLRFTVRAQVWQNLCRRSSCCCSPSNTLSLSVSNFISPYLCLPLIPFLLRTYLFSYIPYYFWINIGFAWLHTMRTDVEREMEKIEWHNILFSLPPTCIL